MYKIRQIASENTLQLRQKYLRPNKMLAECVFENDDSPTTHHLGVFDGEKLVGISSLFKERHPELTEQNQLQWRGVAICEEMRGKKILPILFEQILEWGKIQKYEVLWGYFRPTMYKFIEKNNFIIKNELTIAGIGPHQFAYLPMKQNEILD